MEMKQRVRANFTCGFESIIAGKPPFHDVFEQTLPVVLYPLAHFLGLSNSLATTDFLTRLLLFNGGRADHGSGLRQWQHRAAPHAWCGQDMGRVRDDKPRPVVIAQAALEMHALPPQIWYKASANASRVGQ